MIAFRHLTLVWPGLPWLWLRGSVAGLVLALAFAVTFDVALVTTFIWPDLVELPFRLAVWTALGVVWLASTVSAAAAFPPALVRPPSAQVDPLFARARDAYLARDWLAAETRLRELLALSPTDGEAQLLLGTLLRRAGRLEEARAALGKLSASDAGARWRAAIAAELDRVAKAARTKPAAAGPVALQLPDQASARDDEADERAAA
jgi:tetratricopeptide (TPR) repeat protein